MNLYLCGKIILIMNLVMASFTCRNALELGVGNLVTISMVCLERQRERERERERERQRERETDRQRVSSALWQSHYLLSRLQHCNCCSVPCNPVSIFHYRFIYMPEQMTVCWDSVFGTGTAAALAILFCNNTKIAFL